MRVEKKKEEKKKTSSIGHEEMDGIEGETSVSIWSFCYR